MEKAGRSSEACARSGRPQDRIPARDVGGPAAGSNVRAFGRVDGDLSTSSLLWIRGSGKVDGKVRYKDMIVERGGRISGDVQAETTAPARTGAAPRATPGRTSGTEGKTGPTWPLDAEASKNALRQRRADRPGQ